MAMTDTDALIKQLGRDIVLDPRYRSRHWIGITLIGDLAFGRQGMFGYLYGPDGSCHAELPDDPDERILDAILYLQAAMIEQRGAQWHQCLIQISRAAQSISIQFEYDDPIRWSASPQNLEQLVEALRPG